MWRAFWETSSTEGLILWLHGWAYDMQAQRACADSLPQSPVALGLARQPSRRILPRHIQWYERPDVRGVFADAPLLCGVRVGFHPSDLEGFWPGELMWSVGMDVPAETNADTASVFVTAPPHPNDKTWAHLQFHDYLSFAQRLQDPAFRTHNVQLQAIGSLIARQVAGEDTHLQQAALVVLLYRVITQEFVHPDIVAHCEQHATQAYQRSLVQSNLDLRWKISLGMAVGYFELLQGRLDNAADILLDVASQHPLLYLWPAMATNVCTAALVAALLRPNPKTLALLRKVPDILRFTVAIAPLDHYYHYQEHFNLIQVGCVCAVLAQNISPQPQWAGPAQPVFQVLGHMPSHIRAWLKAYEAEHPVGPRYPSGTTAPTAPPSPGDSLTGG